MPNSLAIARMERPRSSACCTAFHRTLCRGVGFLRGDAGGLRTLPPPFNVALSATGSDGDGAMGNGATPEPTPAPSVAYGAEAPANESTPSIFRSSARFGFFRVLPLVVCIVGGYVLSFYAWNNSWMPTAYVAFVTGLVLAQGSLLPDPGRGVPWGAGSRGRGAQRKKVFARYWSRTTGRSAGTLTELGPNSVQITGSTSHGVHRQVRRGPSTPMSSGSRP